MKSKGLDVVLLIVKIVLPLLLLIPVIFFCCLLVDSRFEDLANLGNESYFSGFGLSAFLQGLVLVAVGGIVLLLSAIALLISYLYKSSPKRERHIRHFKWMLLAPFANQLLFTLVVIVIASIGG